MEKIMIGVVGLGYVGLPLSIEFGKKFNTIGFDLSKNKIKNLKNKIDKNKQISRKEFKKSKFLTFTNNKKHLKKTNFIVISVPTPVDKKNRPNFSQLISASKIVGKNLNKNSTIVYESTVYPGATEEICIPILEKMSGLKWKKDFNVGYSPERINPGDPNHTLRKIKKVVSGDSNVTKNVIANIYSKIITAGIFKAKSIKIAEAAKVIENTQRDLNIGLVNELSIIFNKLKINTDDVIKTASTKWNFIPFKPGLVGGHCIGIDPYYLTYKAKSAGYNPRIILAARKLNDSMGFYIADKVNNKLILKGIKNKKTKILIMGFAFKENCRDFRNTKVIDIVTKLKKFNYNVEVYDPLIDKSDLQNIYRIKLINSLKNKKYDAIIIAVAHKIFLEMGIKNIKKLAKPKNIICDLKNIFQKKYSDFTL